MGILDTMTFRQYAKIHLPHIEAPGAFAHEEPANKPSAPSTTALTPIELAETRLYIADGTIPTSAAAVTWRGLFDIYQANLKAWNNSNVAARLAQWRGMLSDAHLVNNATVPPSQTDTDTGTDPPPRVTTYNPTP